MARPRLSLLVCWIVSGCVSAPRDELGPSSAGTDGTTSASADSSTSGSDDPTTGEKLDVGDGQTGGVDPDSSGCQKVDFLFVIDDSGSMADEQNSLVQSFGGFMHGIRETVAAEDYHVMVVTTGEAPSPDAVLCNDGVCFGCVPEPYCCYSLCNDLVDAADVDLSECGGTTCSDWLLPSSCDMTLGASRNRDSLLDDCGFANGSRFMRHTQPNMEAAFECVARRGTQGDDNERTADAILEALGTQAQAGGCNEGFLRDDAILVVTFITDEEDKTSPGDATAWKDAVVAAKNGDDTAVVVLGLIGDSDLPGGSCSLPSDNTGAEGAPKLRTFAEGFPHGRWASVCAPDYAPFFEEAVEVIDTSCDTFDPPG